MHRREQLFNEKFPLSIVGVLAVVQLLTTAAIVTLEILRIIINIRLTNLFAGIWTAIPFTILWISMFATGRVFRKENRLILRCFSLLLSSTKLCYTCGYTESNFTAICCCVDQHQYCLSCSTK